MTPAQPSKQDNVNDLNSTQTIEDDYPDLSINWQEIKADKTTEPQIVKKMRPALLQNKAATIQGLQGLEKPTPQKPQKANDDDRLNKIVDRLSGQVLETLRKKEILSQFLEADALKQDNRILAAQVQKLVQEKRVLQEEALKAEKALTQFKKITGNLYLKFD